MRSSIFQLDYFQSLESCFKISISESLKADDPKAGFDYLHLNHIWEGSKINKFEENQKIKTMHVPLQKLSEFQANNFKIQRPTFKKQQKGIRK